MKTFLLTFLFMIGLTVVHGQEKMQFSILGGYEHFKNEAQNKTTGYGIGCEFKYYLLKTLYAVGNFHTGINSEFLPRTAIAEVGEIDFHQFALDYGRIPLPARTIYMSFAHDINFLREGA